MRIIHTISLLLFVLLGIGCSTDKATLDTIDYAERIAEEQPDSTLLILNSIDTRRLRTKHDEMRLRLITSEALYYQRANIGIDSLTQPLFTYYFDSDLHTERARAMYQCAMAYLQDGEHAKAMYAFFEAEKSLNVEENTRLRGLINLNMGKIYHDELLYENAIERLMLAEKCFADVGLGYHRIYAISFIGKNYLNIREYDESLKYLTQAMNYTIEHEYYTLLSEILGDMAMVYYDKNDFDSCENVLANFEKYDCFTYNECLYYSYKAILSAVRQDFDSAEQYIQLVEPYDTSTDVVVQYAKLQIAVHKKEYKSAFDQYANLIQKQDAGTLNALQHTILNSQLEVLKYDNQLISLKNQRMKMLYIYTTIVILLILLLLIVYTRYRHTRYHHKISSYVSTIDKLNLLCQDVNQTKLIKNTIERLYRGNINEISRLCEIYYEHSTHSRLTTNVMAYIFNQIDQLKNDRNKLRELEEAVNIAYDGLMFKLRECCPSLSEREMRIALYSYVGFSNQAICLLVDVNTERLPKIKYNMREQIKRSNSPYVAQLIAPLRGSKAVNIDTL